MAKRAEASELQDRMLIDKRRGAPSLHPGMMEEEPVPDITELGLSLTQRHKLEVAILEHAEQGLVRREAEAKQKPLTEKIKAMLVEWGVEMKAFLSPVARVSMYPQVRKSITNQSLLEALTKHHIAARLIPRIIEDATTTSATTSLRITPLTEIED